MTFREFLNEGNLNIVSLEKDISKELENETGDKLFKTGLIKGKADINSLEKKVGSIDSNFLKSEDMVAYMAIDSGNSNYEDAVNAIFGKYNNKYHNTKVTLDNKSLQMFIGRIYTNDKTSGLIITFLK